MPQVDGTDEVEFVITKRDVRYGHPGDIENCIAARAACRKPEILRCCVGATMVRVQWAHASDVWTRYHLKEKGRYRVRTFDEDGDAIKKAADWIAGQTFTIYPPPVHRALGARTDQPKGRKSGPKKTKQGDKDAAVRAAPLRHL